jgi:hypothetical protein
VHDQRDPAAAGGEVGGHRHVAAEADHHVRADPVEDVQRRGHRTAEPVRHAEQVGRRLARQRHRRDQLERVARLRHHPDLEAAGGAQRGDLDRVVDPAERVGGGQQR